MKLQEPPNFVSRCVQFSSSAVDYLDPEDGCSKIYPLIGGLSRDTHYAWISRGPNFEVVSTNNGEKIAAWTFGGILKDTNTRVTCAVELPTLKDGYGASVSSLFAVGLDCYLSYGMVCLFDIRGSKVVKAIQVPGKVSSLAVVDSGLIPEATTPLAPALRLAKGLLAVGLSPGGNVLLLDLCLSDEDGTVAEGVPSVEEDYSAGPSGVSYGVRGAGHHFTEQSDELHPSRTVIHTPGDPRTEGPVSPGDHIAILLNESSFKSGYFMLNLADSSYRLPLSHVEITASLYVPQLASLIIGFSFGCFQVWDLSSLTLVHTSDLLSEPRNVTFFAFQEPADDPRRYCYIWAVYGRRWNKGGNEGEEKREEVNEDDKDDLAFACMHDMCYQTKEWIDGYGWLYQDFVSIGRRFELEFSHGNDSNSVSRCISCHSVDGTLGRGRATFAGRMENSDFEEGSTAESDSLCCMIWHSWQLGRDGLPCNLRHSLTLFDLNQWYRAQMPCSSAPLVMSSPDPSSGYISGGVERNPGSPHLLTYALPFVTEKVLSENGAPLLFARIDPCSISRFCSPAVLVPEEHLFPSALSFESTFLLGSQCVIKMSTPGLQRSLLAKLQSLGTKSYLYPTPIFLECVAAGLKPLYVDIDNPSTTPVPEQREFLLSLALEHHMVSYLIKCAVETADGSASSLGVTLGFLMSWVKERSWIIREYINQLNTPLFDCGGALFPDPQASRLRSLLGRQLSHLSTLLKEILRKCLIVIDVSQEMQKWSEVLEVLALYTGVVQWFCHNGLLPELADEDCEAAEIQASNLGLPRLPYPAKVLAEAYEKRRKELLGLPGVSKVSDVLFIDAAVKECGEGLTRDSWKTKGSEMTGQYPPPSLQALLLTYMLDGLPVEDKHCFVIYLFLDLAALLSKERYGSSLSQLIKFPSAFSLSPSIIKLTQAFWLLDHKDFEVAINVFLDPLICPQDIKLWQHRCVIRAFLAQGEPRKALKYVRVHQPSLGGLEDLKLNLTLLLENGLVHEAFNYQRKHRNDQNSQELLQHFFNGCEDLKQLRWVLQNSLTSAEEDGLMAFLSSQNDAKAQELRVMYYLQRSRVIEALRINDDVKPKRKEKALDSGRSSNLKTVRDAIVNGYASALPSVTRRLAAYCARHSSTLHSWKEVSRPVPLSVNIHRAKQEPPVPFRTKSTLIGTMLDKARETWNPPPLPAIPPPTPRHPSGFPAREKRKREDEDGMDILSILPSRKVPASPLRSSIELMPFICTPVTPSLSRIRNGDGTPLVFPHLSKSLPDFDASRTPSKRARLAEDSKVITSSPVDESAMEASTSITSALLLLNTPTVPRKNRRANYASKTTGDEFSTTGSGGSTPTRDVPPPTPQSILKVRKARDASPSSLHNGSDMAEEEDHHDREAHGAGRLIRFQLPTGYTPSPPLASPLVESSYNLRKRLASPRQPLQRSPIKGLARQPLPSMEHQASPAEKSLLSEVRREVSSSTRTYLAESQEMEGRKMKEEDRKGPRARSSIHTSLDALKNSELEVSADESGEFYSFEEAKKSPQESIKVSLEERVKEEANANDSYGKLFASPFLQVKTRRQSLLFKRQQEEEEVEEGNLERIEEAEIETKDDVEVCSTKSTKGSSDEEDIELEDLVEEKPEETELKRLDEEVNPDEKLVESVEIECSEDQLGVEENEQGKRLAEGKIFEADEEEKRKAEENDEEEDNGEVEKEIAAEASEEVSKVLELGTNEIYEEEQEVEPKSSSIEEVPVSEDAPCIDEDDEEYGAKEKQFAELKKVEPLKGTAIVCQSEDELVVISDSDDEGQEESKMLADVAEAEEENWEEYKDGEEEHEMQGHLGRAEEENWVEEDYDEEMEVYSKEGKIRDGGREWLAQWEKESGIKDTEWTDQEPEVVEEGEEEGNYPEEGREVVEVDDEVPSQEAVESKIRKSKGAASKSLIKQWMEDAGLEDSLCYQGVGEEVDDEEVDDEVDDEEVEEEEEEEVDDEEEEEDDNEEDDEDEEEEDEDEDEDEEEDDEEEDDVVELKVEDGGWSPKLVPHKEATEMSTLEKGELHEGVHEKCIEKSEENEISKVEEVDLEEDKGMEEIVQMKDSEENREIKEKTVNVAKEVEEFVVEESDEASREECNIEKEEAKAPTVDNADVLLSSVQTMKESVESEAETEELGNQEVLEEEMEAEEAEDAKEEEGEVEVIEVEEERVDDQDLGEMEEVKYQQDSAEVITTELHESNREDNKGDESMNEGDAEVIETSEAKTAKEVEAIKESENATVEEIEQNEEVKIMEHVEGGETAQESEEGRELMEEVAVNIDVKSKEAHVIEEVQLEKSNEEGADIGNEAKEDGKMASLIDKKEEEEMEAVAEVSHAVVPDESGESRGVDGRKEVEEIQVSNMENKSQREVESKDEKDEAGRVEEKSLLTGNTEISAEVTSDASSHLLRKDEHFENDEDKEDAEIVLVLESDEDSPSASKENGSKQKDDSQIVETVSEQIAGTHEKCTLEGKSVVSAQEVSLCKHSSDVTTMESEISDVKGRMEVEVSVEKSEASCDILLGSVAECKENVLEDITVGKGSVIAVVRTESLEQKEVMNKEDEGSVKAEVCEVLHEMEGERENVAAEGMVIEESLLEPKVIHAEEGLAISVGDNAVEDAKKLKSSSSSKDDNVEMEAHSRSTSTESMDGSESKLPAVKNTSETKESAAVPDTESVETPKGQEEEEIRETELEESKQDEDESEETSHIEEYVTSRRLTRHQMALLSKSIGGVEAALTPSTPQSGKKRMTKTKTPPRTVPQVLQEAASPLTPTLPTTPVRSSARIRSLVAKSEKTPVSASREKQLMENKEKVEEMDLEQLEGGKDDEGKSPPHWSSQLEERFKKFRRGSPADTVPRRRTRRSSRASPSSVTSENRRSPELRETVDDRLLPDEKDRVGRESPAPAVDPADNIPKRRTRRNSRASPSSVISATSENRQSPELRETLEDRLLPDEKGRVRVGSPAPSVASSVASSVSLRRRSIRGKLEEERGQSPFREGPRTRRRSVEPDSQVMVDASRMSPMVGLRSVSPAPSVASSIGSSVSQRERRNVRGKLDEERLLSPVEEVSHVPRTRRRSVGPDAHGVHRSSRFRRADSQSPDSGSEASSYTSSVTSTRSHRSQVQEEIGGEALILRSGKRRPRSDTPTKIGPSKKRPGRLSSAKTLEMEQEEEVPSENVESAEEQIGKRLHPVTPSKSGPSKKRQSRLSAARKLETEQEEEVVSENVESPEEQIGKRSHPVTPTKSGPSKKRPSRLSAAKFLHIKQEEEKEETSENVGSVEDHNRAFVFSPPKAVATNLQAMLEEMESVPEFALSPPELISHPPLLTSQRRSYPASRRSARSLGPIPEVKDEEEQIPATPSPRRGRPSKAKLLIASKKRGKVTEKHEGAEIGVSHGSHTSSGLKPIEESKSEEEVSEKTKKISSSQRHRSSPTGSVVSEGALDIEDDSSLKAEEESNRTKDDSDTLPRKRKSSSRRSSGRKIIVPYKPRKSAKL